MEAMYPIKDVPDNCRCCPLVWEESCGPWRCIEGFSVNNEYNKGDKHIKCPLIIGKGNIWRYVNEN